MSDKSAIPRTQRITIRLPTETLADLDERAESTGASRSDYLRTLIGLGLDIDVNAIRHTRRGIDELAPIKHSDTGLTLEIDNPPGTVLAVTDEALDAIRAEVNSIGVNYNQAVRSLNRFGKKYSRNKHLTDTERSELQELLDLTGNRMRLVYRRAMELSAKTDTLLEKPSVRLEVKMRPIDRRPSLVGEDQKQAHGNKSPEPKNADRTQSASQPADAQDKRRRRVRGKKKRHDGAPAQAQTPTVSKPSAAADLLHPAGKPTAAEPAAPRHPAVTSDPTPSRLTVANASTPEMRPVVEPGATEDNRRSAHPAPNARGSMPGRPSMPSVSTPEARAVAHSGGIDVDEWMPRPSPSVPESLDEMMEAKTEESEIDAEMQKRKRF